MTVEDDTIIIVGAEGEAVVYDSSTGLPTLVGRIEAAMVAAGDGYVVTTDDDTLGRSLSVVESELAVYASDDVSQEAKLGVWQGSGRTLEMLVDQDGILRAYEHAVRDNSNAITRTQFVEFIDLTNPEKPAVAWTSDPLEHSVVSGLMRHGNKLAYVTAEWPEHLAEPTEQLVVLDITSSGVGGATVVDIPATLTVNSVDSIVFLVTGEGIDFVDIASTSPLTVTGFLSWQEEAFMSAFVAISVS